MKYVLFRLTLATIAIASFLFPAYDALGELVAFGFTGTVDDVSFSTGTPPEFSVGDTFSGSFVFDSTVADTYAESSRGFYEAITSIQLVVGTYSASGSDAAIDVHDNPTANDRYVASSYSLAGSAAQGLPLA